MQIESFPNDQSLIGKPALCQTLDMSRSGIDKLAKKDPTFPKPLKFGESRQASCYYVVSEVQAWLKAKLAERGAA